MPDLKTIDSHSDVMRVAVRASRFRGGKARTVVHSQLATCPSSAPSCANTAMTRTSTSSSTASPKPPRSSAVSPTRPPRRPTATVRGCPGGGERIGGTRRRGVLIYGRRYSCRVPHCRGLPALWRGGLGRVLGLGVASCFGLGALW